MSEQVGGPPKLSKSQKKKKAAQKKKLAKKIGRENSEQDNQRLVERVRDEIDARTLEELNDVAMRTHEFQMLNIKGKLLAHPSESFFRALTTLRQSLPREAYLSRVQHAQRLFKLGLNQSPLAPWGVAMGTSTFIPLSKLFDDSKGEDTTNGSPKNDEPEEKILVSTTATSRRGGYTSVDYVAARIMIWYPVLALCYAAGDRLSCIALRDTCVGLRECYTLFVNDITRLEQFVFDIKNSATVKRLDWVARRVEIPPSPPQTPPPETPPQASVRGTVEKTIYDPFRAPTVLKKRWSDYDDDDDSIGSPMAFPDTPQSLADIPELELERSASPQQEPVRHVPTILMVIPTLVVCVSPEKTVLPVPRISLLLPEEYPRTQRSASLHPMKLQSSVAKPVPVSHNLRVRGRLEHWVREDVEKNLKAKLALASAARKKIEADAENVVYNRVKAYARINTGDATYIGETDILGENAGISVDDVREVITARFKDNEKASDFGRVMLTPSSEGWICKHLDDKEF